jgi:sRNA-binding carbon storage regulator CsrA
MRGGQVKLGFVAPAEVPIHRKEVQRAITDSLPVLRLTEGE